MVYLLFIVGSSTGVSMGRYQNVLEPLYWWKQCTFFSCNKGLTEQMKPQQFVRELTLLIHSPLSPNRKGLFLVDIQKRGLLFYLKHAFLSYIK